ncbi:hypothetical protein VaNZ11_010092 [Volvox africanus]|uniref:Cyclin-like domain-containing protein n=1 Tax=Volvox africanus TaxID=51714 RepID=A0ABQ5S953_9CHLO|nr:hypothetical protein VaNZ11_010092 [Volvox africanus]
MDPFIECMLTAVFKDPACSVIRPPVAMLTFSRYTEAPGARPASKTIELWSRYHCGSSSSGSDSGCARSNEPSEFCEQRHPLLFPNQMNRGLQLSSPRPAGQPCTPTPENKAAAEAHAETHAASCRTSPAGCLHYHQNIPPEHRVLIVGWMRQVCEALGLHASTLFMATSLLDRFMAASQVPTPEGILQLLALASMSVAVKFNEVLQVRPSIWLGLAVNPTGGHLYQPCDLQRCEFTLLQTIDWQLHEPNTFTFLEHFLVSQRKPLRGQTQVDSSCSDDSWGASRRAHSSPGPRPARSASVAPELHENLHEDSPNTSEFCESAVATVAASLAELSLMYDTFLSHEYCTIAQACVMLAQRLVDQEGMALRGVVETREPPLRPPEPGLAACIEALELCCSPGERHFAMAAEEGRTRSW